MQLRDINCYDKYSFGKYIRQKREALRISLRNLATQLKMTPPYLSDIERGNRNAPLCNKEYMVGFVQHLHIGSDEIDKFTLMAIATREFDFSYIEYSAEEENECEEC